MDNFNCLSAHICDDLNKKDIIVSIDLVDACETLRKVNPCYMDVYLDFFFF